MKTAIGALLMVGLAFGGFCLARDVYRSQHCVLLFGHWLSVERTTVPLFCQ